MRFQALGRQSSCLLPTFSTARRQAIRTPLSAAQHRTAATGDGSPGDYFQTLIGEKRFTCTECGKCCTGAGEVWLKDEEVTRIADYLHTPQEEFRSKYLKTYSRKSGWKMLKYKPGEWDCIFLDSGGKQCTIYPVRPLQCSTYPWWPELMPQAQWSREQSAVCEGLDHPDAPPMTPAHREAAAHQLRESAAYFFDRETAPKTRRGEGNGGDERW